jgi:hypothetical protein
VQPYEHNITSPCLKNEKEKGDFSRKTPKKRNIYALCGVNIQFVQKIKKNAI